MSLVDFLNLDDTRLTLDELIEYSINQFSIPGKIVISFSGGKDSTVLAIMACEAIKKGIKKASDFELIFADTLLEIPALEEQISLFFKYVEQLGIKTIQVKRKLEKSYWVAILGKGSFVPSNFTRWCVRFLKMEPIEEYTNNLGDFNIAVGIRLDESSFRKGKYKDTKLTTCDTAGECLVNFEGENKIYPILKWRNCEIWDFLQFHELSYEYPVKKLRELYFQRDTMRYGCWNCTIASDFELLKLHAEKDKRYKQLLGFRYKLNNYTSSKFYPEDWVYVHRKPRNSHRKDKDNDQLQWMGTILTIRARKRLLTELIQIQDKTRFNLISQEEIDLIKEKWIEYPDGDRKGRDWKYYDGPVQQQIGDYF